jgi:serine/threonine-protein kinase HipA
MSASDRIAYVYVREAFAGILLETDFGYAFRYDPEFVRNASAPPVSLTLPKTAVEHTSPTLFSFFDGLIPEGWLLNVVSRNWKIDPNDRFGLLLVACEDCIGSVSIRGKRV